MFTRARLHPVDEINGNLYIACLFFGLVHLQFNGFAELPLLIGRLPVFYKQRDNLFHPAWAWSLASFVVRVPYSIIEAVMWTVVVYYSVGFAPSVGRFFRFMFLLFWMHQAAMSIFRTMAAVARDPVIANTFASAALLIVFLSAVMKPWWVWASWISPLTYGQRAISVNEFAAERWQKMSAVGNITVGNNVLHQHSLPPEDYWYWIGLGVLVLFTVFFNLVVTAALKRAQTINPVDPSEEGSDNQLSKKTKAAEGHDERTKQTGMILPFQPLTMTFSKVNYFVDMPKEMRKPGSMEKRLQLLSNLDSLRQALVGVPGNTGLSTEQRKRLTIAVELVANPSIIFMDEPTSGLDARAAAIVMRTVRNTVDTGRTVVCTIHQPSIDIFEAFDDLLLMKRGGKVIYGGKLGVHSKHLVDYFQGIEGIPPIVDGHNIPIWWRWFYYLCPISWTLQGIISSQLGNLESMITGPGFELTIKEYLKSNFDYGPEKVGISVAALIAFCFVFFATFAVSLKVLNFQKR
ncbi:unnamed protein product [Linum tenue]|uniref:ABC transporter domain-containing protein n=1 Tax=Linum tenue TaxID=586396 RepID=A0AAV0QG04_9ROSI|nr:unnamed protein product [Linum tenue]